MFAGLDKISWDKLAGLLLVLGMHGALLYAAWSHRLLPPPQEATTLFVNFINPPPPLQKKLEPSPPPPPQKVKLVKPHSVVTPPQPVLVANAPVTSPAEPVAPPPPPPAPPAPQPVAEAPPAPSAPEPVIAEPPTPVMLTSDLAVACPQRAAPEYPATSRRLNEQGRVVLRVELDETGRVASARVKESSGFKRLDDAGLVAVRLWHCNAPVRNGEAVRAVALQPFNFVLEGRK